MTEISGDTAGGFEAVAEAFEHNFDEHDEVGAACCVYVGGEPVVDLWGGTADKVSGRPWERDTLQLHFSTTKGVAAICAAMLYQRGMLDYAAPVALYWPDFAGGGKEQVTVAHCLSHQAGLAAVDADLTLDDLCAVEPVLRALEAQEPLWEPGTANGYHAITYGWIVGEIVRRIDGRSLGRFLADEVAGPLGAESYIGLPESEEPRVTTLLNAPPPATQEELELMMAVMGPGTMGYRALTMDGAIPFGAPENPFNSRQVHATEMPAANGISEARGLARIYGATVGDVDGIRLIDDDTVRTVRAEHSRGPDRTLVVEGAWGMGFMLDLEVNPMLTGKSFGHPGAGGSLAFGDLENGVGFAYVMNQMGGGIAGDPRATGLVEAVRSCL
ncbi:MAG: beta-lactamase family protein [Acidimicrobiales bacterium]|nr:beta-lactamase family protein [Acidimicrobiales bacterium]RUA26999.1 MAG: esterase [Actinomycetota bacterium]HBL07613.1 esterase [Acidimicrobiaceae bacterium]HIM84733.1 class A beta-lactamase-related serine hydrolase [Acidimicrobiia bacterium]